ncbi:MAG: MATE family efflux transporter [Clostridia bacterium]|nr:MATE family efflux transporter [Clostridia bacterium]
MSQQEIRQGDFSRGSVPRIIWRLGLPVLLAELVHVLYNIVDRTFIGYMGEGGTLALTGLGICFPLITFIGAFAQLFSTGGATLATIARGRGDDARAERILCTSFTLLTGSGALLTVLFYAAAPMVLTWLGGDAQTLPPALDYFRIYVLGTIPVQISLGMNPFINAQGFPRVGMMTVILGAALNILLDPLLISVAGLGVKGAALATVISQTVSAVWALVFLCGRIPPLRLRGLMLDRAEIPRILRLGVTGFTFRMTNSLTQALVNITLKAWGGPLSMLYVGGMSLINSLREIISLPNNALVAGGQNVMSFNFGARLYHRVSDSIRFIFLCGVGMNAAMWVLVLSVPEILFRVFTPDEELIRVASDCARIYFGAFPFMALQQAGQSTFVALNYPRHALFFSLFRKVVLVAPLTLLLPPLGLGVDGVFWAEFISQLVGATACFLTMNRVIWRRMRAAADGDPSIPVSG